MFRVPRPLPSLTLALVFGTGFAAALPAQSGAPATPTPRPEDVASIDAIVAAVYDVISGPAGQDRDWDRMRSLFVPSARLLPSGRRPDGSRGMRALTVEEYITQAGPRLVESGFFEREIGWVEERFDGIAHRFSAYDSRRTPADPEPFARGINSIQLFHDGARWWIVSIYWQAESPGAPIPAKYLRP